MVNRQMNTRIPKHPCVNGLISTTMSKYWMVSGKFAVMVWCQGTPPADHQRLHLSSLRNCDMNIMMMMMMMRRRLLFISLIIKLKQGVVPDFHQPANRYKSPMHMGLCRWKCGFHNMNEKLASWMGSLATMHDHNEDVCSLQTHPNVVCQTISKVLWITRQLPFVPPDMINSKVPATSKLEPRKKFL